MAETAQAIGSSDRLRPQSSRVLEQRSVIQPFGALIATDPKRTRIAYASANVDPLLGLPVDMLLRRPIARALGATIASALENLPSDNATQRERRGAFQLPHGMFDCFTHINRDGYLIAEFEPSDDDGNLDPMGPINFVRTALQEAEPARNIVEMLDAAVRSLRRLTGYHKVVAYRFTANGDAEVLAEDKCTEVDSVLGLRFTAWDMSQQGRAMHLERPMQLIADVDHVLAPVLQEAADRSALNLNACHLRGSSETSLSYLKSIDISAALNIALIVEGRVWGKLSCHHRKPRLIRSDVRIAAEVFGQMIALNIKQQADLATATRRHTAREARSTLRAAVQSQEDLVQGFADLSRHFGEIIPSDGVALTLGDTIQTSGSVPSHDAIRALGQHRSQDRDLTLAFENLSSTSLARGSALNSTAGVLMIRSAAMAGPDIYFFRDDLTKNRDEVHAPDTPHHAGSWNAFFERNEGFCEHWEDESRTLAQELLTFLNHLDQSGQFAAKNSKDADLLRQQRQDVMLSELNHRVRNTLALIRSLSRQAKASSDTLESYALSLEHRIEALAKAQDLALGSVEGGVSLGKLLEVGLGPFLASDTLHASLDGPPVGLRADVAPLVALVLHEVITNAAKHGALSVKDGVIKAHWQINAGMLQFDWREEGAPIQSTTTRHGFGRTLIENAIPFELDGTTKLTMESSGLRFQFSLPQKHLTDLVTDPGQSTLAPTTKQAAIDTSILLVEDNMLLALDLAQSLKRLGARAVTTAASLQDGLAKAEAGSFDLAILDLSLRGETCVPIADHLTAQGTPFAFVSGYNAQVIVPDAYSHVPLLTKPVDEASLARCLTRLRHAP